MKHEIKLMWKTIYIAYELWIYENMQPAPHGATKWCKTPLNISECMRDIWHIYQYIVAIFRYILFDENIMTINHINS